MRFAFPLAALLAALLAACSPDAPDQVLAADTEAAPPEPAPVLLDADTEAARPEPALILRVTQPDTSDWPEIERRGVLRVLVARDRTNFFVAEGRLCGMEYELVHELELELAENRAGVRPAVDVAFVPGAFDQLLPSLLEGRGDVAVAGLTVTPEREASVAFTGPYLSDVSEIVVAHAGAECPESLDGLSGRTLCLASGTSYVESVARLNADLVRGLTTEDALELVHAGAFDYTVADGHVAELWASVLDGLRPAPQLALSSGRSLA